MEEGGEGDGKEAKGWGGAVEADTGQAIGEEEEAAAAAPEMVAEEEDLPGKKDDLG